jgi:hypothetical protein
MKQILLSFLQFACLAASVVVASGAPPVTLLPGVPIWVSPEAPKPVLLAVKDLQRDLEKVLGAPSPVVNRMPASGMPVIVVAGKGEQPQFRDNRVSGTEAHAVIARPGKQIVLQGEDIRGTVYAVYSFSEAVLGVPPLWFWSSLVPAKRPSIDVDSNLRIAFGPASVKWRAWFPNDQDLLTPWRARSVENFEAFIESMLRLKLNTREGSLMDQECFNEPYTVGREAKLVRDRGLVFTGHHVNIFGSSYNHWNDYWRKIRKREPPKLSVNNVQEIVEFWRYHIESAMKAGLTSIWQLGFRGSRDIPFWETFADAPEGDAARAAMIQSMLERQVKLVREVTRDPAPVMRATFYNENSDFVAAKLLKPPTDPGLIWVFVAARRDHFPAADVMEIPIPDGAPVGYYLNFQFTSSGAHLASAEGPWKMEQNHRTVRTATGRPLTFSVVNAGNIREFLLELSSSSAMMWDFEGFNASDFVLRFCNQYFGPAGPEAAKLYWRFYESYWQQRKPDLLGFHRQYLFQDLRYARALEQLLPLTGKPYSPNPLADRALDKGGRYFRIVPQDSGAESQLDAILAGTSVAIEKLERIVKDADALVVKLSEKDRVFFNDQLRVQAMFMLETNRTLRSVVLSLQAKENREQAKARLSDAQASAARMRTVLSEAEHGVFQGWYDADRVFGIAKIQKHIADALRVQ